MATHRLTLLTLPLAAASIALGACGGGSSGEASAGTGDRRGEFREAALEFAQCMREHGVDMPDPQPDERGLQIGGAAVGGSQRTLEAAQRACQKHLEHVRGPEPSPEQQREFRERALAFARCMREHGIDMPDPQFQSGNRVTQQLGDPIDPNSPAFRKAQDQCAQGGKGGLMFGGPPK